MGDFADPLARDPDGPHVGPRIKPRLEIAFAPVPPTLLTFGENPRNSRRFIYQVTAVANREDKYISDGFRRLVFRIPDDPSRDAFDRLGQGSNVGIVGGMTYRLEGAYRSNDVGTFFLPRDGDYGEFEDAKMSSASITYGDSIEVGLGTHVDNKCEVVTPSETRTNPWLFYHATGDIFRIAERNASIIAAHFKTGIHLEIERTGGTFIVRKKGDAEEMWSKNDEGGGDDFGPETLWITKRPHVGAAFGLAAEWRVPVTVSARTLAL